MNHLNTPVVHLCCVCLNIMLGKHGDEAIIMSDIIEYSNCFFVLSYSWILHWLSIAVSQIPSLQSN